MDEQALNDILENGMREDSSLPKPNAGHEFNSIKCPACGDQIVLTPRGYKCLNCEEAKKRK